MCITAIRLTQQQQQQIYIDNHSIKHITYSCIIYISVWIKLHLLYCIINIIFSTDLISDHQSANINNIIFILSAALMLFFIIEESLKENSKKEIIKSSTNID